MLKKIKKISLYSIAGLAAVGSVCYGAVSAYYTDHEKTDTVSVEAGSASASFEAVDKASVMLPDEYTTENKTGAGTFDAGKGIPVSFKAVNTGTVPVNIKSDITWEGITSDDVLELYDISECSVNGRFYGKGGKALDKPEEFILEPGEEKEKSYVVYLSEGSLQDDSYRIMLSAYGNAVSSDGNESGLGFSTGTEEIELYRQPYAEKSTFRNDDGSDYEYTYYKNSVKDGALSDAEKPEPLSKTGYTFNGWKKTGGAGIKKGASFQPVWNAHSYTVRFHAAGGDGAMPSESMIYDVPKKLTKNTFSIEGYSFLGWADEEGGSVRYTDGQEAANLTDEDGGFIDLYAVWGKNTYTIAYSGENTEWSWNASDKDKVKHSYTVTDGDYTVPTPVKTGYDFKGWTSSVTASAKKLMLYTSKIIKRLTLITGPKKSPAPEASGTDPYTVPKGSTGNIELAPAWKVHPYAISLSTSVSAGSPASVDSSAGYTYDRGTDLYVKSYTIEDAETAVPEPVLAGYRFTGWTVQSEDEYAILNKDGKAISLSMDEEHPSCLSGIYAGSHGNISLLAHWEIASASVPAASNVYDGAPKNLISGVSIPSGSEIAYTLDRSIGYSKTVPQKTDAGTYTVYYKITAPHTADYYGETEAVIEKAEQGGPAINIKDLTYNRKAQSLGSVSAGTGGTDVSYSLNKDGAYSPSVPEKTNASPSGYTVYYRIKGDANHNDRTGSYIQPIKKMKPEIKFGAVPEADNKTSISYTYNGESSDIKASILTTGGDKLIDMSLDASKKTVYVSAKKNALDDVKIGLSAAESENMEACEDSKTLVLGLQQTSDSKAFKQVFGADGKPSSIWGVAGAQADQAQWSGKEENGIFTITEAVNQDPTSGFYFKGDSSTFPEYKNIVLDFDIMSPTTDDDDMMGVYVRYRPETKETWSGYMFGIDKHDQNNGINGGTCNGIWKAVHGKYPSIGPAKDIWKSSTGYNLTELQTNASYTWERGKWQHYRFQAVGNQITVYKWPAGSSVYNAEDKYKIFDYTDPSPVQSGTYGFWTMSLANSKFRYLTVTESDPDKIHIAEKK